jgi:hypothetical protein
MLPRDVHDGVMADVAPAVHAALLLAMLLFEVHRAMAGPPRRRAEAAEMPSVIALANLAVRLHRAPPTPFLDVVRRDRGPHAGVMRVAGLVAAKMEGVGLGAPRFAPATFRIAELGSAADTAEGLLYAALTCLQFCLLGAAHARNKRLYMQMLALVVYPGLEPLHPDKLGALGEGMRNVAPLLVACVQQCLGAMLAHEPGAADVPQCVALCVENREAVAAHLFATQLAEPAPGAKTPSAALAALGAELTATLDMLHHFAGM